MNRKKIIPSELRRPLVLGAALLTGYVVLSAGAAHHAPIPRMSASPVGTAAPTGAKQIVLTLDAARSKVHWTLGTTLHAVHGSFAFNRGAVRIDPEDGKASGEIVADATSGESGDSGRDKKMHRDVIESARFPEVVFRPDRVEGQVPEQGAANVQFHGIFLLHGSTHELTVPAQAQLEADHWKGAAKFRIPYIEWGLKSPSNFFLKADPIVDIEVQVSGAVQNLQAAPTP